MDILHDNSHKTWYQIGTQYEKQIPEFVMNATLPEKEAVDQLPNSAFADDNSRVFPIDSPAATWLSAAYFAKNAAAAGYSVGMCQYIEGRLMKAAQAFGIGDSVTAIVSAIKQPPEEKQAADVAENYGWVSGTGRKYPMFDATGVKRAASYFMENRFNYPPVMRKTIAGNIMRKAAEYGVVVDDTVRKEAGQGLPRRDTLMQELLDRARLAKSAEASVAIGNLVESLATVGPDELMTQLDKIAEVIDMLDQSEGFDKQYGKRMLSPAEFIYDIDPKVAEAMLEDAVELDQHVFSLKKLAGLSPDVFGAVLGDEFVSRVKQADGKIDVEKLGDELFSLPRPDRTALEQHLQTLG